MNDANKIGKFLRRRLRFILGTAEYLGDAGNVLYAPIAIGKIGAKGKVVIELGDIDYEGSRGEIGSGVKEKEIRIIIKIITQENDGVVVAGRRYDRATALELAIRNELNSREGMPGDFYAQGDDKVEGFFDAYLSRINVENSLDGFESEFGINVVEMHWSYWVREM